ncbi:hypothetical protein VNI00_005227 [Paramarasmius palmivorus]|uniref:Uncharacterized protein n=1 Tax=Paramarasmius palmivorus TaxID=297713 RepID=A0AAW0DIW8_9AGAR
MPLSAEDKAVLLDVAVPSHQEFFCRLVDGYPRHNGLLCSISGSPNPYSWYDELFLLRNIAEFPMSVQLMEPDLHLLTARFRACVATVANTLVSVIRDDETRSVVAAALSCSPGEPGLEKDFSCLSTQQLWCAEVVRLEGFLLGYHDVGQRETPLARRDQETLDWLRGDLARFLGVQVVTGDELYELADSVATYNRA